MAVYLAPTTEYKAPTFQELFAPLAIYKDAYDKVKEKYDAEADKAALLKAMMGTDPNNEVSQYMSSYNNLLDETSQMIANNVPYSQLARNTAKLKQMWRDKGVPATTAIEALTKYRDARSKVPGAIGRELTFNDFLADPNRGYSIVDPERIKALALASGTTFAKNNGRYLIGKAGNGQLAYGVGPRNEDIEAGLSDPSSQMGRDFYNMIQQFNITDPEELEQVSSLWVSGLQGARNVSYEKDIQAERNYNEKLYNDRRKQAREEDRYLSLGNGYYWDKETGSPATKDMVTSEYRMLEDQEEVDRIRQLLGKKTSTKSDKKTENTTNYGLIGDTYKNGNKTQTIGVTSNGSAAEPMYFRMHRRNLEKGTNRDWKDLSKYEPLTEEQISKDKKAIEAISQYTSQVNIDPKLLTVLVETGSNFLQRDDYCVIPSQLWYEQYDKEGGDQYFYRDDDGILHLKDFTSTTNKTNTSTNTQSTSSAIYVGEDEVNESM